MFSKKILFPMAAVAMASFVACGDDSSSSPASKEVPATVKTYFDTADIACSETENKCAKIFVEQDLQDTVQCNGSSWEMMILAKPVAGCENAAPAADEPAAGEDPAAGEEPGAGEDPAAGEEPGAGEGPAAGEEPGAGEGPAAGEEPGAGEGPAAGEEPGAGEGPAAGEEPGAGEEPAGPGAGEQPAIDGPSCYMASDIPGMASCLPITQEECATFSGEWVETCPVNN